MRRSHLMDHEAMAATSAKHAARGTPRAPHRSEAARASAGGSSPLSSIYCDRRGREREFPRGDPKLVRMRSGKRGGVQSDPDEKCVANELSLPMFRDFAGILGVLS